MMRQWSMRLGALILACAPYATLDASELLPARDLAAESRQAAAAGGPLIVLYSRADCHFCRTIKQNHLRALLRDKNYGQRIVIREIGQDRDSPLRDFSGRSTTHARFTAANGIKLVPVVAFYGPQGEALAEPIVGARLPDFYQSYLESAIDQSQRQLKTRP
ncbi:hypothetical protein VX159_02700 [Dechloromonas sp. ZY10]|uniref:hypothetical protein n=1 Tax=Dechloromonas aquae TaxID=2664436 RepID=UPI00352971EE